MGSTGIHFLRLRLLFPDIIYGRPSSFFSITSQALPQFKNIARPLENYSTTVFPVPFSLSLSLFLCFSSPKNPFFATRNVNSVKPARDLSLLLFLLSFVLVFDMKLAVPSSIELGSDRAAAAGCIAGVLRRILCRSVRQRRCRDENEEVGAWSGRYQREQGKKSKAASSSVSSPGIVARLMGLESSAVFPYAQPEVISRTRSASSAEAWQGPRLLGEGRSGNGDSQLRKSQSFREVPSYLRKESEEFLVLTFGEYDDDEASELSFKKMGLGVQQCNMKESRAQRQMAEKKRSGNKMSENDAAESKLCDAKNSVSPFGKEISGSEKGMEPIEMAVGSGSCRKKLSFAQGDMEMECSSENSSPVSVFDLPIHADCENLIIPDASVSVCEASVRKSEKEESRNRVSSEVEDDCKKARKCEVAVRDLSVVWASICRIGEEDLIESNWLTKKLGKSEEAQELGFAIGHGILDLLLHETVIDLFNK